MAALQSKITSQGQISVPAEVRRKLNIGPGSVLEWVEEGDKVVVQRAGTFSSADVHKALFPKEPKPRTLDELKEGIRKHVRKAHAGG